MQASSRTSLVNFSSSMVLWGKLGERSLTIDSSVLLETAWIRWSDKPPSLKFLTLAHVSAMNRLWALGNVDHAQLRRHDHCRTHPCCGYTCPLSSECYTWGFGSFIQFVKIAMFVRVKRSWNKTKDAIKHEETSGAEVQSIQLLQSPYPCDVIPYESHE